jgi:hypothetical protein
MQHNEQLAVRDPCTVTLLASKFTLLWGNIKETNAIKSFQVFTHDLEQMTFVTSAAQTVRYAGTNTRNARCFTELNTGCGASDVERKCTTYLNAA